MNYVIINKSLIEKRIEELKNDLEDEPNPFLNTSYQTELDTLKEVLYKSTPLIPEIEKAFDAGINSQYSIGCYADGVENLCHCRKKSDCCFPIYPKKQDYISKLKLDI